MRVDTMDIVCTMSYLIGVRKELLHNTYDDNCPELLKQLEENKNATIIRYLCKLRTVLMKTFRKTDTSLRYDLTNIDKLNWFDTNNILWLENNGIRVTLANNRAADYSLHINKLIADNIHACHDPFPEWIKWDYIKRLFIIPRFTDMEVQKREFSKFMDKLDWYPYHQYIISKYKTATDEIKDNIYDFIGNSDKVVLVVDCENSDVYKFTVCSKILITTKL